MNYELQWFANDPPQLYAVFLEMSATVLTDSIAYNITTIGLQNYSSGFGGHIRLSTRLLWPTEAHHYPLPGACYSRTRTQIIGVTMHP